MHIPFVTFTSKPIKTKVSAVLVCFHLSTTIAMVKFIIAGGMGAILNCVYSSAFSFDLLFRNFLVEPLSAIRTLLPAVFGFLFGTLVVLVWNFMRAMAVRFLLDYNGWFLKPKSPLNKVYTS